jgi:hypothetical protein
VSALTLQARRARASAYGGKYVDRYAPAALSGWNVEGDYEVLVATRGTTLVSFFLDVAGSTSTSIEGSGGTPTVSGGSGSISTVAAVVGISGSTSSSFTNTSGGVWSTSSFAGISCGVVLNNTSTFVAHYQANISAFGGNVISFLENGTTAELSYEPLTVGGAISFADPAATLSDPAEGPSLTACLELLDSRRGLLRAHEVAGLERQLRALLSDEGELEGITVSRASLDGLIAFLAAHQPSTHPNISLNRAGHFIASWSPRPRAKLTLCFDAKSADTADWVGVDLTSVPAVRDNGAIVIGSLIGITTPFRTWVAS